MQSHRFKELGLAVRKRRKSLHLTQEQLGNYAGCRALFIHELEQGKGTLRFNKLVDVLKVLGLQFSLELGKEGLEVKGVEK